MLVGKRCEVKDSGYSLLIYHINANAKIIAPIKNTVIEENMHRKLGMSETLCMGLGPCG